LLLMDIGRFLRPRIAEPLQTLRFPSLRPGHGLDVSKRGEGLVSLGREQKSLQVAPKTFTLGAS
jgi:hypothetical protein